MTLTLLTAAAAPAAVGIRKGDDDFCHVAARAGTDVRIMTEH